jgi:folate-binding protein YgfZ
MNPHPAQDPSPAQGCVALPDWGVLRARGADTMGFLNGQLTQEFAGLPFGSARLAGYCSAKGRLLATFVGWRAADDEVLLACSADLLAATLKRLSMYVLRAKCRLDDASSEIRLYGLAGAAARQWLGSDAPSTAWSVARRADAWVVALPVVDGTERYLLATGSAAAAPALPALDIEAWRRLEVRSAVPRITARTVEQFVPQMVNLEVVGGVNFHKGCYPGQEIVARSQYRGTLKRRMFLFECDASAEPGQELFHSGDADQPAGMVVNVAAGPHAGVTLLAEAKLAALESGALHLGGAVGPLLRPLPLPYSLPEPAAV